MIFLLNAEKGRNGRMVSTAGIATESTKKAIASFPFKGGGPGLWYFAVSPSKKASFSDVKVSQKSFKSGYSWFLGDLDSN